MSGVPTQWILTGMGLAYLLHSGTITWKQLASAGVLVGGGILYLLYRYQESLLYQPRIFPQFIRPQDNPPGLRHPGEQGMEWEDVRLEAADGTKLHAWLIRPNNEDARRSRPTLVYFHENAGNMGLRMDNLKMMYENLNANIFILSYRGYGESEGLPNEDGLYLDGAAALHWIRGRSDLDQSQIFLFGRSLGGGVAVDLAYHQRTAEPPLAGIILENTFASISHMVDVLFPLLGFAKHAILRMKWDSITKIAKITQPILFLSGAQDEIVPSSQMALLHSAATAASERELAIFPTGKHNDTWREGGTEYITRVKEWIAKATAKSSTSSSSSSGGSNRSAL